MSSQAVVIITNLLIQREVPAHKANRAAKILDAQELGPTNVRTAYRLGRGSSWDLVQSALRQVQEEIEDERSNVRTPREVRVTI